MFHNDYYYVIIYFSCNGEYRNHFLFFLYFIRIGLSAIQQVHQQNKIKTQLKFDRIIEYCIRFLQFSRCEFPIVALFIHQRHFWNWIFSWTWKKN